MADTSTTAEYVVRGLQRHAEGAPCECGGYADNTHGEPTKDEIARYDCGRRWACCTAVYRCRVCGKRFIGVMEAPDF